MSGGRIILIYNVRCQRKNIGFYHALLGGAASAGLVEEVFAKGAKRVLFFGSCGSLGKSITSGHHLSGSGISGRANKLSLC